MRLSIVIRFALLHLVLLLAVWALVRAMGTHIPAEGAVTVEGIPTWGFVAIALASTAVFVWRLGARVRRPLHALAEYSAALAADEAERPRKLDEEDEFQDAAYGAWRLWATMTERLSALGHEKQELRTVLDSMAEGVAVTDSDGRIVLWNQAFGKLFAPGATPTTPTTTTAAATPDAAPPPSPNPTPSLRRASETTLRAIALAAAKSDSLEGKLPIEVVRSAVLQDAIEEAQDAEKSVNVDVDVPGGRTFTVRIDRLAGTPPRGRWPLLIVFHEISALRRAERTRRDFLANASHELRTPIATITAAAETLETTAALPPDSHKFVEMIARQSRRMSELVAGMLRLSELEAGYLPSPEVVQLGPLVDEVFDAAKTRLGERTPALKNEVQSDIAAWVDPVACEQIITNLIDNACKHTPSSGEITVRARSEATQVVFEVADTGEGIPRGQLDRIFERFYRVDAGRAREKGGTGLGLAIVRHLVRAHQGTVSVESDIGKGSCFRVTLPEPLR